MAPAVRRGGPPNIYLPLRLAASQDEDLQMDVLVSHMNLIYVDAHSPSPSLL